MSTCPFCSGVGGELLWRDARCRVVHVMEPGYTGYCRVVWQTHVKEMTDLSPEDRSHCMRVVFGVEAVLRELLAPTKINLASFGNLVPHVHWHVIPRFPDDPHYPQPAWGAPQRSLPSPASIDLVQLAARLERVL